MRNISFQDLFSNPAAANAASSGSVNPSVAMGTSSQGEPSPGGFQKGSIDFILGGSAMASVSVNACASGVGVGSSTALPSAPTGRHTYDPMREEQASFGGEGGTFEPRLAAGAVKPAPRSHASQEVRMPALATASKAEPAPKRKKKRKARICKEPGCDKYVVDHGLCIRHGGGKRCNVEDCNCRAQNRGLCWKHGGYTICKVEGCAKRAKSRGICWSHGGGTRCKTDGCTKIAVSLGRCWAHGGGKRCEAEGCRKPASERTNNLCADHFAWSQHDGFAAPLQLAADP